MGQFAYSSVAGAGHSLLSTRRYAPSPRRPTFCQARTLADVLSSCLKWILGQRIGNERGDCQYVELRMDLSATHVEESPPI
jgi:hypothetical protein